MSHGRIAHRGPVFRIPVHLVTLLGPAGALIGSLRRWPSDCGTLLRPEAFGIRKGRKPALPLYVVSSIGIGAAVHTLHAQAKPPVYMIAINEVSNEEGYSKEYVPAAQKAVAPLLRALGTRNVIPRARRAQGFMSRSIPLQSAYCAPKQLCGASQTSLGSELIHERSHFTGRAGGAPESSGQEGDRSGRYRNDGGARGARSPHGLESVGQRACKRRDVDGLVLDQTVYDLRCGLDPLAGRICAFNDPAQSFRFSPPICARLFFC
jgi:hypothetical protein